MKLMFLSYAESLKCRDLAGVAKRRNASRLRAWRLSANLFLATMLLTQFTCAVAEGVTETEDRKASQELSKSWRELSGAKDLSGDGSVLYFEFPVENGSRAHLVVFAMDSKKFELRPALNTPTAPTSSALVRENALAAINAGFFNLSDGESASYVFIDGKKMCEPRENHDLVSNPRLKPFLEQIFNRTEVRFVEDSSGRRSVLFARHNQRLPNRVKLIHSIQAGPRLLPTFTAADEAFIRTEADGKDVDSIGCKRTAARTAFGVTADNRALLLTVAGKGQDEFSSGITLDQLIAVLRRLGCVSAINFDGGTSTTMAVRRTGPDVEALMLDATGDLPEVTELKAKLRRLLASHNADAVDVMKLQVAIAAAETKRYRHSVHDTSALSGCDFAHEPHEQRELEEALRRRFEQSAPAERQHAGAAIVVCGRSPETRVKSILMIVPKK